MLNFILQYVHEDAIVLEFKAFISPEIIFRSMVILLCT